jgi:hypothetical protein
LRWHQVGAPVICLKQADRAFAPCRRGRSQYNTREEYCASIALRHPWDIAVGSHAMDVACPFHLLKSMIGVDPMEILIDLRIKIR